MLDGGWKKKESEENLLLFCRKENFVCIAFRLACNEPHKLFREVFSRARSWIAWFRCTFGTCFGWDIMRRREAWCCFWAKFLRKSLLDVLIRLIYMLITNSQLIRTLKKNSSIFIKWEKAKVRLKTFPTIFHFIAPWTSDVTRQREAKFHDEEFKVLPTNAERFKRCLRNFSTLDFFCLRTCKRKIPRG